MNLVVISGSAREGRISHRVALHLCNRLARDFNINPDLVDVKEWSLPPVQEVWKSMADVPEKYIPFAEKMFSAQGFIFVSPENLIDHFPKQSRKVFRIVTTSNGAFGGIRASLELQLLVYALFGIGSPTMLIVPQVDKKFDPNGNLLDATFEVKVNDFLQNYMWLAGKIVG